MLSHGPRQAHVWLIFDVGRNMNAAEKNPLEIAFVEARDSAVQQFASYVQGWRPKNPDARERQLISLIDSMSAAQKNECAALVRHFVEAALFKLMVDLEAGVAGSSFSLASRGEDSGAIRVHISDDVDHDLIHAFWRWMVKE